MKKTIALAAALTLVAGSAFAAGGQPVYDATLNALVSAGASAPIPAQTLHGVLIGAVEGNGAAGTPDAHVLSVQGVASGPPIPISASALPLPTGAATAANQTAAQSAVGTSATTALTVQGSASGVSLPVQDAATGATGSAVPAKALYVGANSGGNLTGIVQGNQTVGVSATSATTTTLVSLVTGKAIYVTHAHIVASAAANFQLVYGTGTACGTGTVYLDGASGNPMAFAANGGFSAGSGLGPVYVIPAGNALCLITATGGVNYAGSITYTQF